MSGQEAATPDFRVGQGYDVHPFAEGRPLFLGGVEFLHTRGLEGHSDADVLLHAICDALLGAACLGDIGQHFPPGDPDYADIASTLLLARVAGLLAEHGWHVVNVDSTVVAERPRIAKLVMTSPPAVSVVRRLPWRMKIGTPSSSSS